MSSSIAVERLLDRIVGADAEVRVPPTAENIASTLATIAKSTGALIGFEVAMGDEPSFGGDRFAWSPCGLTLARRSIRWSRWMRATSGANATE